MASSGDDFFRSFMSSLATGLSPSFIWPGSGGGSLASAGISQLGNARCAHAGNSAVTGGYGDGFLLLNTAHASLHHIGSTWTGMLGHSNMVDHGATSTTVAHWVTQMGTFSLNSSSDGVAGTKNTTFPTPYTQAPVFVQISLGQAGFLNTPTSFAVNVSTITAGGFSSLYSELVGAASAVSVAWESNGTVLL